MLEERAIPLLEGECHGDVYGAKVYFGAFLPRRWAANMVSSGDVALRDFRLAGRREGLLLPKGGGEGPRVRVLAGVISPVCGDGRP